MNAYEELEAAIVRLAAEYPRARLGLRPLHGAREAGDALIVERKLEQQVRVVRLWAKLEPVVSFYWGVLPPPGAPMGAEHGEGNRYGDMAYRLYFTRALLLDLEDWRRIPLMRPDGSLPNQGAAVEPGTTLLYRPVGPKELELIRASGFRRFPPRLPEQPIFYPVCNEAYAIEIAQRWNTRYDGGGFVTRFSVASQHLVRYERQIVGAHYHAEYWIPAEELEAFNDSIVGVIEVLHSFPPESPP